MNREMVSQKVEEFIKRSLNQEQIKPDENLFELGIIHSLFSVQLMIFLEKVFKIEIDEDEFSLENIPSLNSIVDFVMEQQG